MGQENRSDDKTEMTGGQALINSLYEEGVRVIFGLPGVQMYHAVMPVLDYPDMKFITTRHEQATTYMADGYSRASGDIGVSMVVPGPGLQNASAGITNAYSASAQVLVIAGQINKDKISKDVGMLHEINDQIDIIKPITKWQSRVLDADKIQDAVKECFYHLRTGRPRPVEIEIPPETLSDLAEFGSYIPEELSIQSIDGSSIEEAAGLLVSSVNPVIWAGGGANLSDSSDVLVELAESESHIESAWRLMWPCNFKGQQGSSRFNVSSRTGITCSGDRVGVPYLHPALARSCWPPRCSPRPTPRAPTRAPSLPPSRRCSRRYSRRSARRSRRPRAKGRATTRAPDEHADQS